MRNAHFMVKVLKGYEKRKRTFCLRHCRTPGCTGDWRCKHGRTLGNFQIESLKPYIAATFAQTQCASEA